MGGGGVLAQKTDTCWELQAAQPLCRLEPGLLPTVLSLHRGAKDSHPGDLRMLQTSCHLEAPLQAAGPWPGGES